MKISFRSGENVFQTLVWDKWGYEHRNLNLHFCQITGFRPDLIRVSRDSPNSGYTSTLGHSNLGEGDILIFEGRGCGGTKASGLKSKPPSAAISEEEFEKMRAEMENLQFRKILRP